jgi:hypothetical protein
MTPGGNLEDRLQPPYRSRSEARLGGMFDRYGIDFFYEYPLLVLSRGRYRIWHPDFTLPQYGGLVVEYAGMIDQPDYRDGIRYKQHVFAVNGVPSVFLYPDDLYGIDWEQHILDKVTSYDADGPLSGSQQPYLQAFRGPL